MNCPVLGAMAVGYPGRVRSARTSLDGEGQPFNVMALVTGRPDVCPLAPRTATRSRTCRTLAWRRRDRALSLNGTVTLVGVPLGSVPPTCPTLTGAFGARRPLISL